MPSVAGAPPSPGHLLPLPDNDETPLGRPAGGRRRRLLPRSSIEKNRDPPEHHDFAAAAPARCAAAACCVRSAPQPLRVLPVWGAGAAFMAGAPPARASAAELTAVRPQPRRGRRLPRLRGRVRARTQRRRRPGQVGAAVLRRRGADLPRPLVLARPPRRPRRAHLADRLPAAHLDLPGDDDRRPEPDLRHPRPRRSPRSAGRRAGRSPSRASSRRAAATTSSSSTGSTPASCRGRCRSASAASPTGSFRSSAHCASTERRRTPTMARALPSRLGPPRPDPGLALGLDHLDRRRARRRPGARLPAVDRHQQPGAVRAPLRLAVLGQRRRWRACWCSVIVVAAVRLLLRVSRGRFGSRLLLKLAAIFALVGVVPGVLIYTVSYQFVSRSIESWFDVKVEGALDAGLNLGRGTIDSIVADVGTKTRLAAERLGEASGAAEPIAARAAARAALGPGGRHRRQRRAEPDHHRQQPLRADAGAHRRRSCCARRRRSAW